MDSNSSFVYSFSLQSKPDYMNMKKVPDYANMSNPEKDPVKQNDYTNFIPQNDVSAHKSISYVVILTSSILHVGP